MAQAKPQISEVILKQLALSEMRILTLTVAVRKELGMYSGIKSDLSQAVRLALRKLVAAQRVREFDGVFSLIQTRQPARA